MAKLAELSKIISGVYKLLLKNVTAFFSSAYTYLLGFALIGSVFISRGVYIIFGLGVSYITIGVFAFAFAAFIYKGLKHG